MTDIIQGDVTLSSTPDSLDLTPPGVVDFEPPSGGDCSASVRIISSFGATRAPLGFQADQEEDFALLKYRLLDYNRHLLPGESEDPKARDLHRNIKRCMAYIRKDSSTANVIKTDTGTFRWDRLGLCGSVWACPVCAEIKRGRKAEEIKAVVDSHVAAGGYVLLVTGNAPHKATDSGPVLFNRMKAAEVSFHKDRRIRAIKARIGFIEAIKVWEHTYGLENGWHPHFHQLWFLERQVEPDVLAGELFPRWANYLVKRGLGWPSQQAIDVREGMGAGGYVSKMGLSLSKEMTRGVFKTARDGQRFGPFDLLNYAGMNYPAEVWALDRWLEYIVMTSGKHFVSRYPILKARYCVADTDEDDLLEEDQDDWILIMSFGKDEFANIVRGGLRGKVLKWLKSGKTPTEVYELIRG